MKRYLLFMYNHYYPAGGWDDFIGDYDSIEAAKLAAKNEKINPNEYAEIVDTEATKVVLVGTYVMSKCDYRWKERKLNED